jgi:hypothetical protein
VAIILFQILGNDGDSGLKQVREQLASNHIGKFGMATMLECPNARIWQSIRQLLLDECGTSLVHAQ